MLSFLKRFFRSEVKSPAKDHRGRTLERGEKSVSQRIVHTAKSKHSGVRRSPIDMSQGD